MEQTPMRLEYKVGIFVVIGLTTLLASILILGGSSKLFTRFKEIRVQFSEVQGLFPGSVVSLAGLPVGNVSQINFVPSSNKLEVVLKIERQFESRIVEGTSAEIRTQGALGDKYVFLEPGLPGAAMISDNGYVNAIETDFMKMLTSREDGAARVIDLIKELHLLVANVNSSGAMKNVGEATEKLNSTLVQLDGLLNDLRGNIPKDKKLGQALVNLSNVLEKIDQGKGTLGQLVNDPSVHQSLKAFLGGSNKNSYMKEMIRETIQKSESARP